MRTSAWLALATLAVLLIHSFRQARGIPVVLEQGAIEPPPPEPEIERAPPAVAPRFYPHAGDPSVRH